MMKARFHAGLLAVGLSFLAAEVDAHTPTPTPTPVPAEATGFGAPDASDPQLLPGGIDGSTSDAAGDDDTKSADNRHNARKEALRKLATELSGVCARVTEPNTRWTSASIYETGDRKRSLSYLVAKSYEDRELPNFGDDNFGAQLNINEQARSEALDNTGWPEALKVRYVQVETELRKIARRELEACRRYCPSGLREDLSGDGPSMDLCKTGKDKFLSNVAVSADWRSIEAAREQLEHLNDDVETRVKALVESETLSGLIELAKSGFASAAEAAAVGTRHASGIPGTGAVLDALLDLGTKALAGLAKFLVDRAKQEAVGFVLDRMASDLCEGETTLQAEISRWWLPEMCTLAREERLAGYGAGAEMLAALRQAIAEDLEQLPGTGFGLAAAALFWKEAVRDHGKEGAGPFYICNASSDERDELNLRQQRACDSLRELRQITARAIGEVIGGANVVRTMQSMAANYAEIARTPDSGVPGIHRIESYSLQLMTCAASIPASFEAHESNYKVDFPDARAVERNAALLLTAIAEQPTCWQVFGKGLADMDCVTWAGVNDGEKCRWRLALDESQEEPIERISTVLRLHETIVRNGQRVGRTWEAFAAALKKLEEVMKAPPAQRSKRPTPPDFSKVVPSSVEEAEKLTKAIKETAGAYLSFAEGEVDARLAAIIEVIEAFTQMVDAMQQTTKQILSAENLPGLCVDRMPDASATDGHKCVYPWGDRKPSLAREVVEGAELLIAGARQAAEVLTEVESAEWSKVLSGVLRYAQRAIDVACQTDEECSQLVTVIARNAGTLTAIVEAEDADDMARVFDSLAMPPGGWKRKGSKGAFTVSLTSHVGFFSGVEWRKGQYGVQRLDWVTEPVAPTLVVPMGIETSWGVDTPVIDIVGVYVPLIDPAAFLQYDASEDGRLPGASLTTALSPGLALRLGFRDTPFSLLPSITYRPRLRRYEDGLNEPGADALQIGASVSVDVTLWELHRN